jgi:hypothetical protein
LTLELVGVLGVEEDECDEDPVTEDAILRGAHRRAREG